MLTQILLAVIVYVAVFPLAFWGIGLADKKLKNASLNRQLMKKGANKNLIYKNAKEPAWAKWKERIKFTRADKRAFVLGKKPKKDGSPRTIGKTTRRKAYWGIRGIGLLLAVLGGLLGGSAMAFLLFLSACVYTASIVFAYISADRLMVIREEKMKRMFSVARQKLGQSVEYEANPGAVIRVLDWKDYVQPTKIEFDIPDTFGEDGAEGFMKLFNQNFGKETAWVPCDDPETGDPGWDFDKAVVTIRAVPPLPRMAKWDEHYVLSDGIAWSFFPIALGVENGVELMNPKSGEIENVLGFDVSGQQAKVGEKFGLKVAPTIGMTPQILVAGRTGGGKSLSVETPVQVLEEQDLQNL